MNNNNAILKNNQGIGKNHDLLIQILQNMMHEAEIKETVKAKVIPSYGKEIKMRTCEFMEKPIYRV